MKLGLQFLPDLSARAITPLGRPAMMGMGAAKPRFEDIERYRAEIIAAADAL